MAKKIIISKIDNFNNYSELKFFKYYVIKQKSNNTLLLCNFLAVTLSNT